MTWDPWARPGEEPTPITLPAWARGLPFPQQLIVLHLRMEAWAMLCFYQAQVGLLHRWRASVEAKEEPARWAQLNAEMATLQAPLAHWRHLWDLHAHVPYGAYEMDVEEWEHVLNDTLP